MFQRYVKWQFLEIFHSLEGKNLYLLQRNNGIKKISATLKQDYQNNLEMLKDDEKSQINELSPKPLHLLCLTDIYIIRVIKQILKNTNNTNNA